MTPIGFSCSPSNGPADWRGPWKPRRGLPDIKRGRNGLGRGISARQSCGRIVAAPKNGRAGYMTNQPLRPGEAKRRENRNLAGPRGQVDPGRAREGGPRAGGVAEPSTARGSTGGETRRAFKWMSGPYSLSGNIVAGQAPLVTFEPRGHPH